MAKKVDPREDNQIILDIASQTIGFTNGKEIGDKPRIPLIEEYFSWKRAFINCWTGWPNDGKTTFFTFLALLKSICDKYKWCIWSPEMYSARKNAKGKVVPTAEDLFDELVFMKTGRSPYKHYIARYGLSQMEYELYLETLQWINEHFVFIHPKDRKYRDLIDNFKFFHDRHGFDGFLIDPFKNINHDDNGRFDLYLDNVFTEFKEFAIETDTTMNFIAHPKNQDEPKNSDGSYKICTQFMLAGGAAWNNGMDGIYSIYRPYRHKDPTDPRTFFFNLKQRKQQLVGRVGVYKNIEFDINTNRYYFNEYCPIDGSFKPSIEKLHASEMAAKKEKAAAKETKDKGKKELKAPEIKFENAMVDFSEPSEHTPGF